MALQISSSLSTLSRLRFVVVEGRLTYSGSISLPTAEFSALTRQQIEDLQIAQFEKWKAARATPPTVEERLQSEYDNLQDVERATASRRQEIEAEAQRVGYVLIDKPVVVISEE